MSEDAAAVRGGCFVYAAHGCVKIRARGVAAWGAGVGPDRILWVWRGVLGSTAVVWA